MTKKFNIDDIHDYTHRYVIANSLDINELLRGNVIIHGNIPNLRDAPCVRPHNMSIFKDLGFGVLIQDKQGQLYRISVACMSRMGMKREEYPEITLYDLLKPVLDLK